jgi:hypothetical protein
MGPLNGVELTFQSIGCGHRVDDYCVGDHLILKRRTSKSTYASKIGSSR